MPLFWKTVLGSLAGFLGIFLVLSSIIWIKGGDVSDTIGFSWGSSDEEIEEISVKKAFVENEMYTTISGDVFEGDKGTIFENYITSMPEEIVDGLYVLYNHEGMDIHKAKESLPRYIKQETAYPVYIFYMSDPKSAVIGYEVFAQVSGKEFSEDVPVTFLVIDGEVDSTYDYLLNASAYPTMEEGG